MAEGGCGAKFGGQFFGFGSVRECDTRRLHADFSFGSSTLYDALLDGLEDEPVSRPEEALDLAEDPVEALDVEDDLDRAVLDDDEEHDPELDVNADELLAGVEDESWSDDPVRMYLTQMGEIPLLSRQQEVALAKQIELTRTRFRHKVLECDYVMQTAVKVLRRVQDGELPFDRTVQVSVTDQLEKHQILGRLPHNLRTLETLLKRNRRDYNIATGKSREPAQRRAAWRTAGTPPPPGGPAGRGTRPADPADRADDQDPGGVQPPGGRVAAADPPAQRREPRRQAPRQAAASPGSPSTGTSCGRPRNRPPACGSGWPI